MTPLSTPMRIRGSGVFFDVGNQFVRRRRAELGKGGGAGAALRL